MVIKKVLRKRKNNQLQRLKRILKTKKKIKIYLAGPIAGLEEQQDYRQSIAESLKRVSEKFEILDPWEREKLEMPDLTYSEIEDPEERKQFAEEIVIRDLKDIQSADVLIAYVFRISSGTSMEIFWMNRVLRKPVITIYTAKEKLPLWIYIHSTLVFTSRRKFIIWLRKVLEDKI